MTNIYYNTVAHFYVIHSPNPGDEKINMLDFSYISSPINW